MDGRAHPTPLSTGTSLVLGRDTAASWCRRDHPAAHVLLASQPLGVNETQLLRLRKLVMRD